MKLAIASGKGGTGKTTVAVNLAALLSARGHLVALADCDVEEPNAHLFLPVEWKTREHCTLPVPKVNETLCLGATCRRCVDACRFKALAFMGDAVLDFPDLCHGCGLCALVCPTGAMTSATRLVGEVRGGIARIRPAMGNGIDPAEKDPARPGAAPTLRFRDGVLRIGEAMATPLIKAVKDVPPPVAPVARKGVAPGPCVFVIRDCPPGVACAAINAVHDADLLLLVAEPSPFGLHDLRLAVGLARHLRLPHAVVLNRAGMGTGMSPPGATPAGGDPVRDWAAREGVPLFGVIPFSRAAAECGATGSLVHDAAPEVRAAYTRLADALVVMARDTRRPCRPWEGMGLAGSAGLAGPARPAGSAEETGEAGSATGGKERTCGR
ncbi:ATP-binding protein [Nitratidesulfovibrio sp. 1201_IL3209]|uniref:ATP-binding protein n=1 Tax=Nitratidesulfovibrio sp. 1201_IL3209 TaxID=3084053 RepID=UPI002FDAB575